MLTLLTFEAVLLYNLTTYEKKYKIYIDTGGVAI